jgi:hypothetical protein
MDGGEPVAKKTARNISIKGQSHEGENGSLKKSMTKWWMKSGWVLKLVWIHTRRVA